MTEDILITEIRDGVATITLNRPRQMNALSAELRRRLVAALDGLSGDDAVRAVIVTGAGEKAFTAGVDLKELETAPLTTDELGPDGPMHRAIRKLGKPTIAAVNGFAITGGMELAINCDILVASTSARFADTHARVGIVPGWGMSQLLPRIIGPVRARYMSFTGNFVDAATAKAWGLVLEVLPPDELMPFCQKLAVRDRELRPRHARGHPQRDQRRTRHDSRGGTRARGAVEQGRDAAHGPCPIRRDARGRHVARQGTEFLTGAGPAHHRRVYSVTRHEGPNRRPPFGQVPRRKRS